MYNNAVVSDLQCRFSEGEVVTWEEFYKWIDDILDGFDTHDHSGVSGAGPTLSIANMAGYAALNARVAALEGAGYATQTYVDNAVAGLASVAWAVSTFYNQTYINALETYLLGQIDINSTSILDHEGRIAAIEADYATETWVGLHYMTNADIAYQLGLRDAQLATLAGFINTNTADISTNAGDIDACEGRLNTIESSYATEAWVEDHYMTNSDIAYQFGLRDDQLATLAGAISDNEGDISGLDGRVGDIEGDYTTGLEAEGIAVGIVEEHEAFCSCFDTC